MFLELSIIFVITFFVRFVGVVAGGGAIILFPLLFLFGLSPAQAVATNRVSILSLHSTLIKFSKHKQVKWKIALYLLIPALIGTISGTFLVIYIDQELFKKIIGVVLLATLPFMLLNKDLGLKEKELTKTKLIIGMILSVVAGFLSSLFGLTGIWYSYLLLFLGLTFLQSIGTRKIIGLAQAVASLFILIPAGLVNWPIAITMLTAGLFGSWLSAFWVIKVGNKWIKFVFTLAVALFLIKVVFF